MNWQLGEIQSAVSSLEGQRITGDYFYTNQEEFVIAVGNDVLLYEFLIPSGEVLDFMANFTSHEAGGNNATKL